MCVMHVQHAIKDLCFTHSTFYKSSTSEQRRDLCVEVGANQREQRSEIPENRNMTKIGRLSGKRSSNYHVIGLHTKDTP